MKRISGLILLYAILFLAIVYSLFACRSFSSNTPLSSEETSIETDREALVALYNATDGDYWVNNASWLSERSLDEWFGVTVGEDGRVNGLRMSYNDLRGELPPELGNLTSLELLSLPNNFLNGPLPPELGNLPNLFALALGSNALSGSLPPELGSLTKLRDLSVPANQFEGEIPSEYGDMSSLRHLNLSHNKLTGEVPTELLELIARQPIKFNFDANRFSGCVPSREIVWGGDYGETVEENCLE